MLHLFLTLRDCRFVTVLMALAFMFGDRTGALADGNSLTLHYDKPATYFEEALVIGNGTLGATVYGGIHADRISLNDITLWTGGPETAVTSPGAYRSLASVREYLDAEDYRNAEKAVRQIQGHYSESYQPIGWLTITYPDSYAGDATGYARRLDISDAVATTEYSVGGVKRTTDYFASAPDSVIVVRLKAEGGAVDAVLQFASEQPCAVTSDGNELSAEGFAPCHSYPPYYKEVEADEHNIYDPSGGIRFMTVIRAQPVGGTGSVTAGVGGTLRLSGCEEVVVTIVNATSFNGYDKDPAAEDNDYAAAARRRADSAAAKTYDDLLSAHVNDYHRFFDRVSIDLGTTDPAVSALPTDEQLLRYTVDGEVNPELEALYFQYGRYLLIACSRTTGVPANLQGLWNEKITPPWSCNYTTNINLEENYWPAEVTNLTEMHAPLLTFVKNMSVSGAVTAREYYGIDRGWCAGHNSDIWAMTNPVGLGTGTPKWANWAMGGAWLSTHIYEHYLFTMDKDFLREYYPILRGAAEFCMAWLVEKDGELVTSPSTSPENMYVTDDGYAGGTLYGGTADIAMTRECLLDAVAAAEALGTDKKFVKAALRTIARLRPYHIGQAGNLQEWYHDWKDNDPQHRHQSHLFGLYPGHHITPEGTPDIAAACAKTLDIKGDKTTGWSTGWRVNIFARLKDGVKAYATYRKLLSYVSPDDYVGKDARRGGGTYPNLLDAHSPFQIDGNFGGCAGVAEMLIQSTPSVITLLPALPDAWRDGSVRGLCARGGFIVDMEWRGGSVTSVTLTSRQGGKTTVVFGDTKKTVKLKAGETATVL